MIELNKHRLTNMFLYKQCLIGARRIDVVWIWSDARIRCVIGLGIPRERARIAPMGVGDVATRISVDT